MRSLTILALALSCAVGAMAQDKPPAPDKPEKSDIIVIGESDRDQRERQVRAFVRDLTDTQGIKPVARFDRDAVCPAAVGLTGAQDDAVTARMRRVAASAQIRLAVPGCRPNALVIFARDKQELVRELLRAHPAYFTGNEERPVELAKRPGPTVAWYLQDVVDRNGVSVSMNDQRGYRILGITDTPSRISPTTRPIIVASVVVIEYRALAGLTTTQVGDYAAMRAFTRADPDRLKKSDAPTILTVLDAPMGSEVPLTLTHWDLAYLRGYNAISADRFAPQQRAEIGKTMLRDLEHAAPRED
ncbi:hypothetical protein FHR22_002434 [Sphingopyxis panaciterrae]|uniref:hypothetical protein n=1 Tax=Sphingopyxis panaciterrae TaxID=363841 RepID=UPI0014236E8C|nr:hypothetical protein [Sphingopyxis panaciterrae]NIJ37731.1 hypothetical protein [Sphingopyxis panaciterrae]